VDKTLPSPIASSREILAALRTVLDLPDCVTSLDLSLKVDALPVMTCTFMPSVKYDG